jgi:hypothetical protein
MVNITEEENKILYYDLDECLNFCKTIEDNNKLKEIVDFHVFWNVGLPFERKQLLGIKSYLCTQDLENTRFNLWCNVDLKNNEFLKPYLPFINLRIYNPAEEIKGTVLEGRKDIIEAQDEKNWAKGDLFRILILHKYGGLYTDVDVAFLRSFSPILDQEFMYKWGLEKKMINGAVMRLFANSKLSNDLMDEINNGPIKPNTTNWSTDLYQKVRNYNKDWTIFPSGFFNSEWQDPLMGLWNPMKKYDFDLYEGSFCWHWHNKWLDAVEVDSKWYTIEQKFEKILKDKKMI